MADRKLPIHLIPKVKPKAVAKVSSRGDTDDEDEQLPDYPEGMLGVQQAYADIHEIFTDVARDYPEFTKEDEEGGGQAHGVSGGGGDKMGLPGSLINADRLPSYIVDPDIRHDEFALEFIQASKKDLDKAVTRNMLKTSRQRHQTAGGFAEDGIVKHNPNAKGTSLKMIYKPPIWPHQESLYRTLGRLPLLRSLVLDDSKLNWLRDLGSLLPNVTTLSVMRCRLTSLDGTFALPNLEYLFASDNLVKDPSPVGACTRIRYVDLSDNQISEMGGFTFLKDCIGLTSMKLMENPVAKLPNFHTEMRRLIPSIRELRPRILHIHGPDVFSMYDLPQGEETPWPPSRGGSGTATPPDSCEAEESLLAEEMASLGGRSMPDEGQRLRGIYNPGRAGYQKRALTSVPYTVDEMDVLMEELEAAGASTTKPPVKDMLAGMEPGELQSRLEPFPRVRTVPGFETPIPKSQSGKAVRPKTELPKKK